MPDFSKLRFPGIEASLFNENYLQLNGGSKTRGNPYPQRVGFLHEDSTRQKELGYVHAPTIIQVLQGLSLSYLSNSEFRLDDYKDGMVGSVPPEPANSVDEWILADQLNKVVGMRAPGGVKLVVHHYDTPIVSVTRSSFEQAYDALNELVVENEVLTELTKDRRKSTERKIQIPPQSWHP